jgi:hypothetical protein
VSEISSLTDASLSELDDAVETALAAGDEGELPVLGYGEISLVVGWPPERPAVACKRLPLFADRWRFDAYRATLADYVEAIADAGVVPVETEMRPVEHTDGTVAGYVVQPILPAETLVPAVLAAADPAAGHPALERITSTAATAVGPRLGLDAQVSNWAWDGEWLTYLDVSTPLIWSEQGTSRLDMGLLAAAYPAILRWPLRRFIAPGILDTYRDLRKVFLDVAGNLIKDRLDGWLGPFLAQANPHLDDLLTEEEVRRYYRSDARLWEWLLRLRRADRAWHVHVRRRPYPILLPKQIER